jgi:hypothetical protein
MVRLNEIDNIDQDSIDQLLSQYFMIKGTYFINDDGYVTVMGDCSAYNNVVTNKWLGRIKKFPIKFLEISGNFVCRAAGLTTLIGSPIKIGGNFDCSGNNLLSLELSTTEVRDFICSYNELTSLVGLPKLIKRHIYCNQNPLKSLEGLPDSFTGYIRLTWNPDLPLLRLLRCDTIVIRKNPPIISDILNKYNGPNFSRASILACQKELVKNGFEGNASW